MQNLKIMDSEAEVSSIQTLSECGSTQSKSDEFAKLDTILNNLSFSSNATPKFKKSDS